MLPCLVELLKVGASLRMVLMSNLKEIRQICIDAINEVAIAEKVCREELEAQQQNDQDNRNRILIADDRIESFLLHVISRCQNVRTQADRILNELQIPQPPIQSLPHLDIPSSQSNANEINNALQSAETRLQELVGMKNQLLQERRKWWKFW